MKVFALGGYGKVGLPAIKLLVASDLVTEITVAGRDLERAEQAAGEVGEKGGHAHKPERTMRFFGPEANLELNPAFD